MVAVEVKELTGAEAFDAISSTLQLAPLPDNAERLRLAQVFPTHGRQCDIPLKIARTIAHDRALRAARHPVSRRAGWSPWLKPLCSS